MILKSMVPLEQQAGLDCSVSLLANILGKTLMLYEIPDRQKDEHLIYQPIANASIWPTNATRAW